MGKAYGICYNLQTTPYFMEYRGYTFYFSSENHLRKFQESARVKSEWLTDSLTRRFHFLVNADEMALFQLYLQIEQRGFRVVTPLGVEIADVSELRFDCRCGNETDMEKR